MKEGGVMGLTPATSKMEDDSTDFGIFLFKNSKSKASNESIFQAEAVKPIFSDFSPDFGMKWMKKFLRKMINPSLLFKPITPVPSTQLQTESSQLPAADGELIEIKSTGRVKKVTRGNRRHKIKTRRQRAKKLMMKKKKSL